MRPLAQMMGLGVLLLVYVCSSANATGWDDRWYRQKLTYRQSCGETSTYEVRYQICCGGKVFPRPYPSWARSRHSCCSGKPYYTKSHKCCDGVLKKGGSYFLECCGKVTLDNTKQLCCDGKVFARKNKLTKCCGSKTCHPRPADMPYYKWKAIVYAGTTTAKPTRPSWIKPGKKVWTYVNGKLVQKDPDPRIWGYYGRQKV